MQLLSFGNVQLEYDEVGSGEPLLLIHGGAVSDTLLRLLSEPSLASSHRVIFYRRRGYGGSSRGTGPFTIEQQAADARGVLQHLGIRQAHVAGHSSGGVIAIQLALDAPDIVGSLVLLEPALVSLVPSGRAMLGSFMSAQSMHQDGDHAGATDAFLSGAMGAGYRQPLEDAVSSLAFERAVADCDALFEIDFEALQHWRVSSKDAAQIEQAVLLVVGEKSLPVCHEVHSLLRAWLPHAQEFEVENADHAHPYTNSRVLAEHLAQFLDGHGL